MPHPDRRTTSRRTFLSATSATTLAAASAATLAATGAANAAPRTGTPRRRPDARGFVEAVLAAFTAHRLVAVGEVHGLQEHHDALGALLTDPRLPEVVDDVVVEFGNALHQPVVDRFTAGVPVGNAELRPVWRDTTQSPLGTWDAPVYENFYRTIRAVNGPLPAHRRIRVLLGDPPIEWSETTTPEALGAFLLQRDAHAASVVTREVLRTGRRALICYGAGHVLHGSELERQTGERVYSIATLTPLAGDPGGLAGQLSRYPARTVIPTSGTWLGDVDAGLVFPAPFKSSSGQPVNSRCGTPLRSVLDAGLYLGPAGDLTMSRENPALYLDPAYWAELHRRNALQRGRADLDRFRQEQPVGFAPETLPPPLLCPS